MGRTQKNFLRNILTRKETNKTTLTTIEDNSAFVLIKIPQELHELLLSYGFELVYIKDFTEFRYNMHGLRCMSYVHVSVKIVELYGQPSANKVANKVIEDITWWKVGLYPKKEFVSKWDYEEAIDEKGNFITPKEFSGEGQGYLIDCLKEFYEK